MHLKVFNLLFQEVGEGSAGGDVGGFQSAPSLTGENKPTTSDKGTREIIGKGTFYEGIEPELFEDMSLQAFKNASGELDGKKLIKSYIHTKKAFGKDKMTVPDEFASEDDWKQVFTKLGVPDDFNDYKYAQNKETMIDPNFAKEMMMKAHENRILPKQAQQLLNWYEEKTLEMHKLMEKKQADDYHNNVFELKKEWGQGYDRNLALAKAALNNFADAKTVEYLKDAGLDGNVQLIKLFANIGRSLNEDTFKGEAIPVGALTPSEAKQEINRIMGNYDHPYHKKDHPGHKDAIAEVNKYYNLIYS